MLVMDSRCQSNGQLVGELAPLWLQRGRWWVWVYNSKHVPADDGHSIVACFREVYLHISWALCNISSCRALAAASWQLGLSAAMQTIWLLDFPIASLKWFCWAHFIGHRSIAGLDHHRWPKPSCRFGYSLQYSSLNTRWNPILAPCSTLLHFLSIWMVWSTDLDADETWSEL